MTRQFSGKTSLFTGGGTGIGRAAALALAAEGCIVTIAGRAAATLEQTVSDIKAEGGEGRYVICDVSDEASVAEAVKVAVGDTGRLDFAVNSAGIDGGDNAMTTAEYSMEMSDQTVATNVRGMFLSMKGFEARRNRHD